MTCRCCSPHGGWYEVSWSGPRVWALVVRRQWQAILPFATSQALSRLLTRPKRGRWRFWLNPRHTGLDREDLAEWTRRRELRPFHLVSDLIPITNTQF